tara:strand:- start:1389 stop:1904 length:516 start_codon:yes stop_codon:yes gene_type:complete
MLENSTELIKQQRKANNPLTVVSSPATQKKPQESFSQPASIDTLDCNKDHFIERNGIKFAGTHLILDLWGASNISCLETVENTLREAVEACGASLLSIHLHHFTPNSGISGVAVLAESHISIHTWPERGYAALDIFMCGDSQPENSIAVLKRAFQPSSICINQQMRGAIHE